MKAKIPVLGWKKNLRKVPAEIADKIGQFAKDEIVVACTKKIPEQDIVAGRYAHLGITMDGGKPKFEQNVVPDARVGRYSRVNAEGQEIVRKDLPKTTKLYTWEAPSWGSYGLTHTCIGHREVYQRQQIAPQEFAISIELLGEEQKDERLFVFKFAVDAVLNRQKRGFKKELFSCLNLLQENVGNADVFSTDAKLADYLKTLYVNWEILPPGQKDQMIATILSGVKAPTPELRARVKARYELLAGLKPEAFIHGTSGFRRYFGAKFNDRLVAFENLEYGNAMYVMFDKWETLSKMTRLELLSSGNRQEFERIVHTSGWETNLRELIKRRRKG